MTAPSANPATTSLAQCARSTMRVNERPTASARIARRGRAGNAPAADASAPMCNAWPEGKAEPKTASAQEPQADAWLKTELARNAQRPYPMDFIRMIFMDLSEIHGDRNFADDPAMQCSMARFHGDEVLVISNVKGRTTKDNVKFNFGLPNPEGYRKAMRIMQFAEKFKRPIFTLVDTDGAYPGIHAEERGQAEAIAYNLREMARLEVPIIATVIGVGGSGGVLAIAVADRVLAATPSAQPIAW